MAIVNTRRVYPLRYTKNIIWLIVCGVLWPPLGICLFIKNGQIIKNDSVFYLRYKGSWFWAFFWSILFFPIAVILMALRGADIVEEIK